MADPRKHESEDLEDYEVLDANDTLDGNPGDDPLDRGVVTPDRWSAGVQYALKGEEDSESLDELLAEEEPDETVDDDEESWDENETGADVTRLERDDDADPRAGRLAATEADVYGSTTTTCAPSRTASSSPATPGSTAAGRARRKPRCTSSTTRPTTRRRGRR